MNRTHFTRNKFERKFLANPHQGRRSRRLFVMVNRFEPVSFPVGIRHLQLGQVEYQEAPAAVPLKLEESSTIPSN